jgi:CheY-like chemotaxis protein
MKKILIVDDRSEIRELVEVTLNIGDYTIFQADNGEKAIEIAKQEKPDLIIMDVMMPGKFDGVEATRIIKSDPELKKGKLIMLTSMGKNDDLDRGFGAGADDYFIKPFSPLDLIKKVEEVLG